ncbi:MAG: DUF4157 domain-containing protein [Leptonema illini]|uniref:DUF4157 domain-containing protein n=1 Tax=Leptonema illini TaxID=183 RepID=A0A833GVX7_9LEPT|nr:MAG: DUF4157 domain-containing protein [Leptonema illini]
MPGMHVGSGAGRSEMEAMFWQAHFGRSSGNPLLDALNPFASPLEETESGGTSSHAEPSTSSTISRAPAVQPSTAEEGFPLNEAQAEKVDTALAETGQPLPEEQKAVYEAHTGHDFSRVRIHTGAAAEEAADSIGAKAFAKGSDIVFAKDQYNPSTAEGRGLIGHELAHVAQSGTTGTGVHRAPKEGEKEEKAETEKPWYKNLGEKAVEYTLDGLIKLVENIPIALFGPFPFIADLFRSGVVGFLKRTAKEGGEKILGLLGNFVKAVTSASFIKAYTIGLAKGFFVDGLWGTVTLLWDIVTIPVKLYGFGKQVVQSLGEADLGAEMQKIGSLMLDAGKYLGTNGKSLVEKLVENAKTAKIDDVADAFANLYNTAKEKATELGGSVADIFVKYFAQKPEKIGEELGNTMGGIVGGIAFDALLGVVTAGAAAAAKTALASARTLVQPLLNLLMRTGQKAKLAVQGVWSYAKRITASARTGILTWIKKVSAELGAKAHAIIESIENFVERLLTRANKGKKAEAELASELAEQKAVQLVPAIAEAKAITAAHEKAGAPISVLLASLSVLRKRFRWIKGFHAEGSRLVPGHKRIVMQASEHVLDEDYDPKEKEGGGDQHRSSLKDEFSIEDWTGYPDGPRPKGPFRILDGAEYENARALADSTNKALHYRDPSLKGLHIHEVHPVKFGGSPSDIGNKIYLRPPDHAKYTVWWNRLLKRLNQRGGL